MHKEVGILRDRARAVCRRCSTRSLNYITSQGLFYSIPRDLFALVSMHASRCAALRIPTFMNAVSYNPCD